MEKQIDLNFKESILVPYGITLDTLASLNGYQEQIVNTEYVPAVGSETMNDPSGATEEIEYVPGEKVTAPKQVKNPDYVKAVGEEFMANPDSPLVFIAAKIPEVGMTTMIARAMQPTITAAEQSLAELKKQPAIIAGQLVAQLTKSVTE